jgi:RNA polymerase sigma-70 factor (ECF subfamily)
MAAPFVEETRGMPGPFPAAAGNKIARPAVSTDGRRRLRESDLEAEFERVVLPHLPSAYNLARWLTRNGSDADDVVQEAFLRAYRFFPSFRGTDARAWILAIVRNSCWTFLRASRPREVVADLGEADEPRDVAPSAEEDLVRRADGARLARALEELPAEFREAVVLRELEELSYREIAEVVGIPIGTVMSRLARARRRLREALARPAAAGVST